MISSREFKKYFSSSFLGERTEENETQIEENETQIEEEDNDDEL
jgi:hypothetical protein